MQQDKLPTDIRPADLFEFFEVNSHRLKNACWLANAIAPQCRARRRGWSGGSLQLGQDPSEFAQWLILLAKHGVKSYTEIGCWAGGSLYLADSYLRCTVDGFIGSTGIDITSKRLIGFDDYKAKHKNFSFVECNSQAVDCSVSTEAAFIDGDHSQSAVIKDFQSCSKVSKLVGFHDIALPISGCPKAWEQISSTHKTSELKTCTPKERWMKGIGVVYMA